VCSLIIDAIRKKESNPLITFAVISYNQEDFIRDAVLGAFSQAYSPLEIVFSDDCSQDATYHIIETLAGEYEGPHTVVLNRNNENLGLSGNVNKVMALAKGEVIILAGGDDVSLPDRAKKSLDLLFRYPKSYCVSFSAIAFRNEQLPNVEESDELCLCSEYSLASLVNNSDFHINGATRAYRRSIYDTFGPLKRHTPTEDSTLLLRCLMMGRVLKCKEPQVLYRIHGGNYYASEKKYNINYDEIHRQYLVDVEKALELNLINAGQKKELVRSLCKKLGKRRLRADLFLADRKWVFFLSRIVTSGNFRLIEKLRMLREIVSGNAR